VVSQLKRRVFETSDQTDIWYYRDVEYPIEPIPILDLYGSLKGKLLGPRMSFWELREAYQIIDAIAHGKKPHVLAAPDVEVKDAIENLRAVVNRRLEALQDRDWELLVVDYLKAQGAHVDESEVGGNRAIIDAEARFDHGDLGEETWRVQVKRYQDKKVDWPEIEHDLKRIGEARFCYVSVFGFTAEAIKEADVEGRDVRLLKGDDFALFVLGGKVRDELKEKLSLPSL
jgi:predicted Mrr-cat superfamily restriction endonuclease